MKKVCVMGAGTMGLDVAQVFATKGFEVTVRDISDEILDAAKAKLIKGLDKKVAKGKMTEEAKEAILGNMSFTTDLKALADMDLIVEAILERMDIKKSVFGLFSVHHRDRHGDQASGQVHRHALLQPRYGYEADRGHSRCAYLR